MTNDHPESQCASQSVAVIKVQEREWGNASDSRGGSYEQAENYGNGIRMCTWLRKTGPCQRSRRPLGLSIFISRAAYPLSNRAALGRADIFVDVLVPHLFTRSHESVIWSYRDSLASHKVSWIRYIKLQEVQVHPDSNSRHWDRTTSMFFPPKILWQGLRRPTMRKDRSAVMLPGASWLNATVSQVAAYFVMLGSHRTALRMIKWLLLAQSTAL
ncbi:hypothetical protein EV421DRAFT_1733396 [Armillaria borealis]|uniref:Uncharacterized protein n=1 Tax=Armillaria borealis TaxID=47425 RepID=A0AA39JRM6_9AGAR|nr:hypothetical protein EV421DRAFT_1733396 [Armillaria borealis]